MHKGIAVIEYHSNGRHQEKFRCLPLFILQAKRHRTQPKAERGAFYNNLAKPETSLADTISADTKHPT